MQKTLNVSYAEEEDLKATLGTHETARYVRHNSQGTKKYP
jgi:hypothetical protein